MRDRNCESFERQVCTIRSEVKSEHVDAHPKVPCIQLLVLFLDDLDSNRKWRREDALNSADIRPILRYGITYIYIYIYKDYIVYVYRA